MLVKVRVAAELIEKGFSPGDPVRPYRCVSGLPPGARLGAASVEWTNGGPELVMSFDCPGEPGCQTIAPVFRQEEL